MANPLKGINPNLITVGGGLLLIAAAGAIGGITGMVNISSAAVATVGAVITGVGVVSLIKQK